MADTKYFATLPSSEIGDELLARKDDYYRYLEESGRRSLLFKSYDTYFKSGLVKGNITRSGDQGEYVNICVNHYSSLLQNRLNMTVSQRPDFEPKAINTDYESQAQVKLATGLLEYYERVKKMERFTNKATEFAIRYGEGFVGTFWNPSKGERFALDEKGKQISEGDLEFETFHTFQVIRDPSRNSEMDHSWAMIKRYKNRWDMAAKYPELADKIIDFQDDDKDKWEYNFDYHYDRKTNRDEIPVYTFMHRKSEVLPEGRYVEFTAGDMIYGDGPLPYREIPVFRIAPGEQDDRINGYTNAFDLLPMQDALDKLESTVLTNQAAFGVQNIAVPKGNGINVINMSGGLNIVEYDSKLGPPIALQLTSTPREIFQHIEDIKRDMETLIGVNSVARGNPEKSLESGAALALIQSMAIQFAQGLQQSYAQLLEDVGTSVIHILQDYASTPRVALIAGKANRSYLREFKGSDLQLVSRVVVDMGNPVMRTTAGRVNLAEQLLQNGLVATPQQYIEVLTSGKLEPIYESEQAELMLIRSENEQMQQGIQPSVIRTDNHALHIQEHKVVLSAPEDRANPVIVQANLAHIAEHELYLAPPVQVGPDGKPLQPEAGAEGVPQVSPSLNPMDPTTQEASGVQQPNLPGMPVNPLTESINGE